MGTVEGRNQGARAAISLIIPCCNEADGLPALEAVLPPLLARVAEYGTMETILIDDGSTDDTWALLQGIAARIPNVRIIRHRMNHGLGAALRTGFSHAHGKIVVTTDADGTYPLAEIPDLLAQLKPEIDIVTASPYHPHGGVDGVPQWRLLVSKAASQCYRIVLRRQNSSVHTYTSLFRAYRREVLPYIMPEHEGFLAVTEILVRGTLSGFAIAEYPTTLRGRRYGQSKARVVRITVSHLRFLASLMTHRVPVRRPTLTRTTPYIATPREASGG